MPGTPPVWRRSAETMGQTLPSAADPPPLRSIRQGALVAHRARELYATRPESVTIAYDRRAFVEAMGATLYIPAHRATLMADLERSRRLGLTSVVLDLEDSVAAGQLDAARRRVLSTLAARPAGADLAVFVRLRNVQEIAGFLTECGDGVLGLDGFALAKATPDRVRLVQAAINRDAAYAHLQMMPIIETIDYVHAGRRVRALSELRAALDEAADRILCVRVGATDLAGLYGLRRTPDVSVHELHLLASALGDMATLIGGPEGFCLTGVVYEHLARATRVLRPQLRQTPFAESEHLTPASSRGRLVRANLDGLVREVVLDRANGLIGKTVIHPDQALVVSAMGLVDHTDHVDAQLIAADGNGGAFASTGGHRMNENRPHTLWAQNTLARARAFGVLRPDRTFADALDLFFEEAMAFGCDPHA